ncbi:serine/threonine-protein kinase [Aliivibrio fischeri]|uniref:serine/threonine protein kinase n=1 Tax=Aliivibrio fischeri TaxID=668 RepID=UPI00135E62B2|nr:protein kinase [Aliivibrio fischeri]
MLLGTSSTQIFYHLLDLDDGQQQKVLDTLKENQPEIHQEITALLGSSPSEHFSDLLGFHAQQTCHFDWDLSNQTIDKYQLRDELGRGGMGVVYSAHRANGTFEQELAIKFIQPSFNNLLDKRALFEEAQLLARLNHPYIAKVFDGGEHQNLVYVVMEKVIGSTLNDFLVTHELSKAQKLHLFSQVCKALEHAHQHNVLHADLKPENILIDKQHSPKLIDFNLTQKVKESTIEPQQGVLAFSEQFASPEQKSGGFLTQQSDIFSLGKILHLLFPVTNENDDIHCIQTKAMQESLDKRYRSVLELRLDIEAVIASRPISLKQHRPCYTLTCLLKRKPIPSFLCALLMITGIAFSSLLALKNHQLEQEKIVAENMMYEVTQLLFHSKGSSVSQASINSMLELTRRRILSNPDLPAHIKQRMLLAMMTPIPTKQKLTTHHFTNNN